MDTGVCLCRDWLVRDWLVRDWLVRDWLVRDWLVRDWLVRDWLCIVWLGRDRLGRDWLAIWLCCTFFSNSEVCTVLDYWIYQVTSHLFISVMFIRDFSNIVPRTL
jgi:hypothetical protein